MNPQKRHSRSIPYKRLTSRNNRPGGLEVCTLKHLCFRGFVVILLLPFLAHSEEYTNAPDPELVKITFDKALSDLFSQGYPQKLEEYFCSLGTNPDLGFRMGGTSAEHETSERVEIEMKEMGLSRVRREPVPVDACEFKKATLTVGSREMMASTYGGVPGTSAGGISAPIVYVKGGGSADYEEVGDVSGKLVLVDYNSYPWFCSAIGWEAQLREAAGIVLTGDHENGKVLKSGHGSYDLEAPPLIEVCRDDGDWLKSQIQKGEINASMLLDQEVTLAEEGGVGYNVLGELPGSSNDGQKILLMAHQDACFYGAMDNTAGLVNVLTIAKAFCNSGFRPKHTIIFLATTAEEYGRLNSRLGVLQGAWWCITREHREWVGQMRSVINMDVLGEKDWEVYVHCNSEFQPMIKQISETHDQDFPFGCSIYSPSFMSFDAWEFSASGIPVMNIVNMGRRGEANLHTQFDTAELVDWGSLERIARFVEKLVKRFDDGLLPYDLHERAKALASSIDRKELSTVGADPHTVAKLMEAIDSFSHLSRIYQSRSLLVPSDKLSVVNQHLLDIEKTLNEGLVSMNSWYYVRWMVGEVLPHHAVLNHIIGIEASLEALKKDDPDISGALKALQSIGFTEVGLGVSHSTYRKVLKQVHPSNPRVFNHEIGKLPVPIDVIPEYRAIEKGELSKAISSLEAKYKLEIIQINRRLREMGFVIEDSNSLLERVLELLK
jgi:Iap family predicted aminopeptidase